MSKNEFQWQNVTSKTKSSAEKRFPVTKCHTKTKSRIEMSYQNENHNKNNNTPIAFVDIDETICFYEHDRLYEQAIPNYENINKINKLYDQGWIIVYWTARGSTQPNNQDRLSYIRQLTTFQLQNWGAKFHRLEIGDKKPLYDLVIDDKAKRIEEL